MNKSLILLDTLSIKKYIFATRYLKEIRGASSLLDELNRITTVDFIQKITRGSCEMIYANGGTALFIIPSDSVSQIEDYISKQYNHIGAKVSISSIPYKKDKFDFQKDYPALIYKAEQQRYKTRTVAKLAHPFFRDCNSNKQQYAIAGKMVEESGEISLLSSSSRRKIEQNTALKKAIKQGKFKKGSLWYKLNDHLNGQNYPDLKDLDFPGSFEDISAFDPKKYIALIYADGNDMGQTIRQDIIGLDAMGEFSKDIDDAIYKSTATAIIKHLNPVNTKQQGKLPFDILLIGGDDLVMVVPGIFALDTAKTIGREFEKLNKKSKSLCIGLSFVHAKYPIHSLLNITEGLLKSAKKERARRLDNNPEDNARSGMINYMLIQESGSLEWEDHKRNNFRHEKTDNNNRTIYERTCRPYTFNDLDKLMALGKDFKEEKFPVSKLHILKEAAFKNLYQSMFKSLYVLTRSCEKHQKVLYKLFNLPGSLESSDGAFNDTLLYYLVDKSDPVPKYQTAILDLLDIYNFLEDRGTKKIAKNEVKA